MSQPVTFSPREAYWTARGSPILPNPTTATGERSALMGDLPAYGLAAAGRLHQLGGNLEGGEPLLGAYRRRASPPHRLDEGLQLHPQRLTLFEGGADGG